MNTFVHARQDPGSDVIITVSAAYAKSQGLEILDGPATAPRRHHTKTSGGKKTPANRDGGESASKPEEATK